MRHKIQKKCFDKKIFFYLIAAFYNSAFCLESLHDRQQFTRSQDYYSTSQPSRNICSVCGKIYKHRCALLQHINYECQKERRFKCFYCSYRGKRRSHVKSHIGIRHKEKKVSVIDLQLTISN